MCDRNQWISFYLLSFQNIIAHESSYTCLYASSLFAMYLVFLIFLLLFLSYSVRNRTIQLGVLHNSFSIIKGILPALRIAILLSHYVVTMIMLKTLFNIVEAPFNFLVRTLMSVLYDGVRSSDGSINSQEYKSFEIYAVTIKIWLNITTE